MPNMLDIAGQAFRQTQDNDPIIRSLLDTDFYKILMCQFVFRNKPQTNVRFQLLNRSQTIPLADLVDEAQLRAQLDHVRGLELTADESRWLASNAFYGKQQMFGADFLQWFEDVALPPYHLERVGDQFELTFEGSWPEVMLWEVPALAIIMELRSRAVLATMHSNKLQALYDRALAKLDQKIETLAQLDQLRIADFGTRRRHSFAWQDVAVSAMAAGLGDKFLGTSNCLLAKNHGLEAIGTNAHELPMVYAALADSDAALRQAPYDVLNDWQAEHDGNLRIILPDTYGTQAFLKYAPDWLAKWTGIRIDSGAAAESAEAAIDWWRERGENPAQKLVIFSDGLDVDEIAKLYRQFAGRVKVGFGWGTKLTNDFADLTSENRLAPFALVCKAVAADGRPTVKLSDNANKSTGPQSEVDRYKRVFEMHDQKADPVVI